MPGQHYPCFLFCVDLQCYWLLLNNQVTSVYQVIESAFSVSVARVSQTTKAIACSSEDAVLMGLAADSPALRIDAELYAENDELLEVSMATFNPDSFHIRTEVKIDTL